MRKAVSFIGATIALVVGLYLVVRALVALFITFCEPGSYQADWAGLSLHSAPGLLAAAIVVAALAQRCGHRVCEAGGGPGAGPHDR